MRAVHARGPVRHLGRGELARLLHPQPTIQVRAGREKGQSPARLRDAQAALAELPEYPLALLLRVHRTPSWTALGPRFCPRSLSTFRAQLIAKGLIYATGYGEVDFTVPKFDEFIKRTLLDKF